MVSGLACLVCSWAVFAFCGYSVYAFVKYYYVPLLFQGLWMVMITYLQVGNWGQRGGENCNRPAFGGRVNYGAA